MLQCCNSASEEPIPIVLYDWLRFRLLSITKRIDPGVMRKGEFINSQGLFAKPIFCIIIYSNMCVQSTEEIAEKKNM